MFHLLVPIILIVVNLLSAQKGQSQRSHYYSINDFPYPQRPIVS